MCDSLLVGLGSSFEEFQRPGGRGQLSVHALELDLLMSPVGNSGCVPVQARMELGDWPGKKRDHSEVG